MELSRLADKFKPEDLEWRIQSSGKGNNGVWCKVLTYVTNRAIMERLDTVCGIENWCNEYTKAPDGGVLCGISIKVNGEWVTKWDGAESTQVEAVKGGLSGAMKRAGVQWGIGRYLYSLTEMWGIISDNGSNFAKTKDKTPFRWDAPQLPEWAVPKPDGISFNQLETIVELTSDMSEGDRDSLRVYYCNAKKIPVVKFDEMFSDLAQNFIEKFDTVYNSWKKITEK